MNQQRARDHFSQHLLRSVQTIQRQQCTAKALTQSEQDRIINVLGLIFARPTTQTWQTTIKFVDAIAPLVERSYSWSTWVKVLQKGQMQSREMADEFADAIFSLLLGFQAQQLGEWAEAENYYQHSVAQFARQDSSIRHGIALGRLGFLAYKQDNLAEALRQASNALSVLPDDHFERHRPYYIYGVVSLKRGDIEDAVHWIEKSLEICQTHDAERLVAMRYRTLGWAFSKQGDIEQAHLCLSHSVRMFNAMNDVAELAITQMNLGIVLDIGLQPLQALDLYAMVQPIFQKLADRPNLALLHNNQGMAYGNLGRIEDAIQAYQASLELHHQTNNFRSTINVLINMGDLYFAQEMSQQAQESFCAAQNHLKKLTDQILLEEFTEIIQNRLNQIPASSSYHVAKNN